MTIYALVTADGTACGEAALCSDHFGLFERENAQDDVLACRECGVNSSGEYE